MNARSLSALDSHRAQELILIESQPRRAVSIYLLRTAFWMFGLFLAAAQAWILRYRVSSDSISYLDMSDGVLPGYDWHRLVNGVWSPLYPFLLGLFRRTFHISPEHEIAAAHLLNIAFFVFAFACFEFFLHAAIRRLDSASGQSPSAASLPRWAFLVTAYSLFLWASISEITLGRLRPDMLLSGFLYLSSGLLLRMYGRPAQGRAYLTLGVVLGVGFLAKAPMLPIGVLILGLSFFVVENWRPAVKMAAAALALAFLVGTPYYVPLSGQIGRFSLGESSTFNYVIHVDQASPQWYLQNPGFATGSFAHSPEKIFADPPAYAFALPTLITHPLRFDPSYWLAGVRPHFAFRPEAKTILANAFVISQSLRKLLAFVAVLLVLVAFSRDGTQVVRAIQNSWPVWSIGVAGCLMYIMISVEGRYIGAFLVLFCCTILVGFQVPQKFRSRLSFVVAITMVITLLYPMARETYVGYRDRDRANSDADAARALESLGVKPGDRVARISPLVSDYGAERILRVEVAAEVDYAHAQEFWNRPLRIEESLLHTFSARGVTAVIATSPKLNAQNAPEWKQLGSTQYWVWLPNS